MSKYKSGDKFILELTGTDEIAGREVYLAKGCTGGFSENFLDKLEKVEIFRKEHGEWIPADEPPKTDDYILLSFENFTIPMVGRYEKFEDGSGNYYLGDCDEKDTCLANNLFVNGWQPLPAPYRPDQETSEQPKAAWKEAMMRTFLGRNT